MVMAGTCPGPGSGETGPTALVGFNACPGELVQGTRGSDTALGVGWGCHGSGRWVQRAGRWQLQPCGHGQSQPEPG